MDNAFNCALETFGVVAHVGADECEEFDGEVVSVSLGHVRLRCPRWHTDVWWVSPLH